MLSGKADDMTGSEQIDGLQAKAADRKNRWKPPGTKQASRSRRGRPAPRPRSGPRRKPSTTCWPGLMLWDEYRPCLLCKVCFPCARVLHLRR